MTIEEIMQVEKWAETGFAGVLADCAPNVYRSRDIAKAVSPRIEVAVTLGEEKSHHYIFPATSQWICDTWAATLVVKAETNRQTEATSEAHYNLIGQIRARLSMPAICALPNAEIIPQNWIVHQQVVLISSIRAVSSENSFEDANDIDATALTFELMIYINPSVFPANANT